jgi:Icc protein
VTVGSLSLPPPRSGAAGRCALLGIGLAAAGCLEYSPHQIPTEASRHNLEAVNRLQAAPWDGPLRFAVIGDVQLHPDHAAEAVDRLNQVEGLAFVVQLGDFTELGMLREYELMRDVHARLRVPWLLVIGNHDLLSNGGAIYDRMFGPRNLAFTFARTRVVLLDDNSREYGLGSGVPDLDWLAAQLAPDGTHDRAVVLAHVPSQSTDLDPALREPFEALLDAAGVPLVLHGHDSHHRSYRRGGVEYVVAASVRLRQAYVVTEQPSGELAVGEVVW